MARILRYLLVLLFTSVSGLALAQGEIYGTITDETGEPIINAQVFVTQGGIDKGAVVTDFDGRYSVKPLTAGSYDVRVNYVGYKVDIIEGVTVSGEGGSILNFKLERASNPNNGAAAGTAPGGTAPSGTGGPRTIVEVEKRASRYVRPLIEPKQPGSRTVLTDKEIEKMPTRNPLDAASTAPGVYQGRSGGGLNIGGGRDENTLYVVDGIVQVGSRGVGNLPFGSIAQMSIITGGLPARYGDATGGVVSITTKGVTSRIQGAVGAEHSVDGFNNRQAYFNLSGPLFSRTDSVNGELRKRPIVGFALSGNLIDNQDVDPTYGGNYVVKEEERAKLEAAPLVAVQGITGPPTLRNASELLNADAFEVVKRRPQADATRASLLGKLDFQLGNNMNLTLGAQGFYSEGNVDNNYDRRLIQYSPDAISRSDAFTGRGFLRFTQRFPQRSSDSDRVISNAFYSVQADYQKETLNREDPRFGREIFKYGYVGKFFQDNIQTYTPGVDSATGLTRLRQDPGYTFTNARFERSDLNPVLANYTSAVYDLIGESSVRQGGIRDIRSFNGLLNGDQPNWTFGNVFSNVGNFQEGYRFENNDQISVGIDASLDLKTRKTTHSLEFGLYYQQRTERNYRLDASLSDRGGVQSLWERAYLLTNTHFDENLDRTNPLFQVNGEVLTLQQLRDRGISPGLDDTILYNYAIKKDQQSLFDLNLRRKLGIANPESDTRYINVYELDPSMLSVDMFSADELFNSGRTHVRYLGYDYKGNRLTGTTSFNDFFTARDADNRLTRPVGAFQPNYIAGYLSDNFRFRDILFNVGVRVDRYDANTKVLKDPYSLYAVRTVGDPGADSKVDLSNRPSNIGPDYVIYIDNNNSSAPIIAGYRSGDDWYDPSGKLVDDPGFLKEYTGGTDPVPYLENPNIEIDDSTFNPDDSFEDYTPQVNVMPRLSFSFPIADQSLFYAHYNVVVQRPRFQVALTPFDYYYLPTLVGLNTIINNPNLRPERNTDYEVGFQQVLTKQSAITLSAFYKERKDQIQQRRYLYALPISYRTYGNRDFSTTKGLRVKYDLRRVGPFQMTVSYTLQFVEGTGSDRNEGDELQTVFVQAQLPNLRLPYALQYDSRHNIVINADYRFFEYNPVIKGSGGPKIFGKHPLQNAGINMIFRTRSGEPYTRRADPVTRTIQGSVNGARLPWHYSMDVNLDKDFALRLGSRKLDEANNARTAAGRRSLFLNAFVYVRNVLNTREILNVYGYTGSPTDNGYLNYPVGSQAAQQQLEPQAYIDQYQYSILDPTYLNTPRQVNVGLRMNF